jgi:hypothetical protein
MKSPSLIRLGSNVKNDSDEKFPKMLDSDTSRAGLNLATTAQPAIALLSGLAMGITRGGDPQEPVGALEAQTKRPFLFENGELVTKREDLRLQCGTGSKTGGNQ